MRTSIGLLHEGTPCCRWHHVKLKPHVEPAPMEQYTGQLFYKPTRVVWRCPRKRCPWVHCGEQQNSPKRRLAWRKRVEHIMSEPVAIICRIWPHGKYVRLERIYDQAAKAANQGMAKKASPLRARLDAQAQSKAIRRASGSKNLGRALPHKSSGEGAP